MRLDSAQTARHLYRIAQEAVNNALKHARAKNIYVKLTHKNSILHLQIADDGRGLPRRKGKNQGMGMDIMRHRANIIGASFEVNSVMDEGATIDCELHLKHHEH